MTNAHTSTALQLPPWVVLHVPHDSTQIPAWTRPQFAVDDATLQREIARMTDHRTFELFAARQSCECVRAKASRLVVDVERFLDDAHEPMAARGLGVIYRATSDGGVLRHPIDERTRARLLAEFYEPHHAQLEAVVDAALARHGRCLVIDCHSFPHAPLPFEDASLHRPQICVGTDAFHTPPRLRDAFVAEFAREGWSVAIDTPFAGALVPASKFARDRRVMAVMVEVERELYLDPLTWQPRVDFASTSQRVQSACARAVAAVD